MANNSIIKALDKSFYLSQHEYEEMVTKAKRYVVVNNSTEKYYERLMNIFTDTLDS